MIKEGHAPMGSTPRQLVHELYLCQRILDNPYSERLLSIEHYSWPEFRVRVHYKQRIEQLRYWLRNEQEVMQ
jgi:hypothetical protein